MKATIHGIAVEGTPQEIAEFKALMEKNGEKKYDKPFKIPPFYPYETGAPSNPFWKPVITCGKITNTDDGRQPWEKPQAMLFVTQDSVLK